MNSQNINVIDSSEQNGIRIEILEYNQLNGSADPGISEKLYFSQKMGIKLRQVRIVLSGRGQSEITTEAGTLHYLTGNIDMNNKMSSGGGIGRRILNAAFNNESLFRPTYKGKGEVLLEPSFRHYAILSLTNDELILDDGMFYCATSGLQVGIKTMKNISSALFGSDGLTQTTVKGTGLLVVEIPVPFDELREINLNQSKLQVDGKFAIMRTGNVNYSVKLSNKGILKSWLGGEGLLETFEGTGSVWIAPTASIYKELSRFGGIAPSSLMTSSNSSNTNNRNPQHPSIGSGVGNVSNLLDNFRG